MLEDSINIDNCNWNPVVLKKKNVLTLLKITFVWPNFPNNRVPMGHAPPKKQFLSAEIPKSDHKLSKTFILSNYNMFWLRYCLSILCGAFLLKSVISSHNSCGEILFRCFCGT